MAARTAVIKLATVATVAKTGRIAPGARKRLKGKTLQS